MTDKKKELDPKTLRYELPPVNVHEGQAGVVVEAAMPGVDDNAVEVAVEDRVLTLSGRVTLPAVEGARLIDGEFAAEGYRRSFRLPEYVDAAGITAHLRHGILRVTLPKREELKTRKITVTAN